MMRIRRSVAISAAILLAVSLLAPGGGAQTSSPPATGTQPASAKPPFNPEQLEQVVAPITLYPDPVIAQIFLASTYPIEVVQAARFVKANPNLKGDALNEALKKEPWDDSVKSLLTLPQVLAMMDENLDWTQKLGAAFLGQQKETMDAVQRLRARGRR